MRKQAQALQSFFHKNAEPGKVTSINLSAGPDGPAYFSLGVNSTVPFVSLAGVGGAAKEFSWNEPIEIPAGTVANVLNSSRHKGDIQIQSGTDFARPSRITFPISMPLYIGGLGGRNLYLSEGFIDTRTARRAWVSFDYNAAGLDTYGHCIAFALYEQHVSNPEVVIATVAGDVSWFVDHEVPLFTAVPMFPLGQRSNFYGSPEENIAHALPDYMRIAWEAQDDIAAPSNCFATLEY